MVRTNGGFLRPEGNPEAGTHKKGLIGWHTEWGTVGQKHFRSVLPNIPSAVREKAIEKAEPAKKSPSPRPGGSGRRPGRKSAQEGRRRFRPRNRLVAS
jgi:hypothetical protein